MPSEYIVDKTSRFVRLKWRRDAGEPGYVQIATCEPGATEQFVDLDAGAIDKLIKGLHKAKNQALGGDIQLTPGPEVTVESDATAAARLDVDRYRATRRGDR